MFTRMRLGRSLCVAGVMLTLGGATLGVFGTTTYANSPGPTTTDEYGPTTTDEYGPIPTDEVTTTEVSTTTDEATTTVAFVSQSPLPPTTTTIAPNVASEAPAPTLPATGSSNAGAAAILGLVLLTAGLVVSGLSRRPRSLES